MKKLCDLIKTDLTIKIEEIYDDSRKKVVEDIQVADKINSIFPDTVESNETYTTYKVYIIRENDTIEMIMQNYGITRDLLEQYNDLNEIKIGDKLIIPSISK